ncbi:MAG TPA: bifunctional 4-hydroxy-2-oxoglutarate aldolase/2-dehydro-3-deoxy-phosphogluconate aldolase [Conexibacter sp.]|jgi:2-dehydro-3-deoxyphosphogluconate aldolase/(4S)-4-hydroxy-2-oxoglutarate aldolase
MSDRLAALAQAGVIAVVRAPSAEAAIAAGEAIVAGGVPAIEVTFTTPDALRAIERLAAAGVLVGAGTVTDPAQAASARDAGAQFLVSPGSDDELVAAMTATGLVTLAGAYTASEAMRVRRLGVDAVKLFPAGVGGVALLRALREPFPDLAVVPTGGVSPENVASWLDAGALAVGAGGALCPAASVAAGEWDQIAARARAFAAALEAARAS